MGSRVWLELGERALKQTRVEASSPQSPSQLVGLQNHKVVRVGRALKDHPVAPPWRGQEHSSHGAGFLWKVSQRGDNRSVPVQELGGPSQHSRVEEAGEARLVGTAWAQGQGFSSTAPNTVWFPRLRTIQARRKTLRKVQQKPLKGIVREWTLVSAAGHSTACHSVRSHWLPWDRVSRACLGPGEAHLQGELLAGRFRAGHGASLSAVGILFSSGEAMVSRAQREDHQQALFPSHSWMGMGTAVLLCHLSGHSVILFLEQKELH